MKFLMVEPARRRMKQRSRAVWNRCKRLSVAAFRLFIRMTIRSP